MTTIAAISTPPGVGGIAVVRLSGPEAVAIASRHLNSSPKLGEVPEGRRSVFTTPYTQFSTFHIGDSLIDEVVVTLFHAPHSYTGEDVVEISCHGSLYVQETILNALLASGARLAEPGEFTRRAFLNGKLNLSQAEAVADLIDSTNATQHRLAVSQLRGGYAQELKGLRQQLLDITALLELELDFSQEDVEFADRKQLEGLLSTLYSQISKLIDSFKMGNAMKRGVPVAIIGRPNAGKSSLLNALLHDDRAIVSDIPGTTRDTIEETFVVEGTLFRIIDTAGLRQSDDPLEAQGVLRSINAAAQADIIIYVHDATQPWTQAVDDMARLQDLISLQEKHIFLAYNKIDLPEVKGITNCPSIAISAKEGTGLDRLTKAIAKAVSRDRQTMPDVLLTNVRHLEALKHTNTALLHVVRGLAEGLPADLVAIDLRDALHHLGTITGEVTTDEVLGNIFGRFCVGK